MRPPPSENLRKRLKTFHSMSVGGLLVGLLKKISYSIFKRRSCESRTFSSSSVVTGVSMHSVVRGGAAGEVPVGHEGEWNESKLSAVSSPAKFTDRRILRTDLRGQERNGKCGQADRGSLFC